MILVAHHILVVDDNPAVLSFLKTALTRAGHAVTAVGDVASARQAMREWNPDLLITDVRVAGFNGLSLVALSSPPIPAIVVTGFPDAALEAEAHNLGAEFLVKPVTVTALTALVDQKLSAASESMPTIDART